MFMNILLTNDDGIYAPGLMALVRHFGQRHRVTVVAPDRERSAVGHGITLHQPLRASRVTLPGGCEGFAVSGTPADCIKLGVVELLSERPDVVVSGINPGPNVGVNINYSGTVAAAKEAALYGLHALAVSMASQDDSLFDGAAGFVETLAERVRQRGLPFGTFLNVNLPGLPIGTISGIRVSRQGIRTLSECFEKRTDPRNRTYYWQGADLQTFDASGDVDGHALEEDCISITPIKCDMTDYEVLKDLAQWDIARPSLASSKIRSG
ncbi:MAG: 5'/3'-nucleotidase SurE [Desulfobacterales bacterium]